MRRPGSRATYERLLARIRRRLPGVTLRSTFIVGFPGETENDFDELREFIREAAFDHLGVFTYSHEEGTTAYALSETLTARVKQTRKDTLMKLQRSLVMKANASLVGGEVSVMVDGPAPDHRWVLQGRTRAQAPEIDSVVYLTECDPTAYAAGSLVSAVITGSEGYDLLARPVCQVEPIVV
jgi:ribosomal protein S12 methylthiotransferase